MRILLITLLLALSHITFADQFGFTENKGQWEPSVKFKANIPGGFLLIKKNSLEYIFYDTKVLGNLHALHPSATPLIPISIVSVNFQNANEATVIETGPSFAKSVNYFIGNDSSKWQNDVKTYGEIWVRNLYDNIDLRIYTIHGKLKYEYIVMPEGDPAAIQVKYDGIKNLKIEPNELLIETDVNVFKEFNPYTFQEIVGETKAIDAHFIQKNNFISFEIGTYDKSQKLIIDPELVFSTYSGSFSDNWAHTATYDNAGNLYAGGSVFGESFLVTQNVFQPIIGGASNALGAFLTTDIVIQKYSSDGSELLYSTFLGGQGSEVPHSLVVNSQNELVVFGTTSSANFPISATAYDTTFNGGTGISGNPITTNITYQDGADIFVSVISSTGNKLLGSTFIGGSGNDGINDTRSLEIRNYGDEFRGEVVVDSMDNIYVASVTKSRDFPVTDNSKTGENGDAVVFRFSPKCEKLQWSTAISGSKYDAAFSLKVSSLNELYVCGVTTSDSLSPIDAFKNKLEGISDGFIAKYTDDILQTFSYIGTPKSDLTLLLDLDTENNVYALGLSSGDYNVTPGVYRNKDSGQFIQVLSPDLKQSVFSTVIGSGRGNGIVDIVPTAFLVNECGNMYIAGWGGKVNINTNLNLNSSTANLPITTDAFKKTTSGSSYYFTIIEAKSRSLLYGSFFGSDTPPITGNERGDHLDGGTCRFDKKGIIYHAACVCKAGDFVGFPLKNANTATHNSSNCNLAAFKFEIDALVADFTYLDEKGEFRRDFCSNTNLIFENKSSNGKSYEWFVNDTLISRREAPSYSFTKAGNYKIKLVAYNNTLCIKSDSMIKNIQIIDFKPVTISDTAICPKAAIILKASGGEQYKWSSNVGAQNISNSDFTLFPNVTDTYQVEIKKGACSTILPIKIAVSDEREDFTLTAGKEICLGDSIVLSIAGGFDSFKWSYGNKVDSVNRQIIVSPETTTTYQVSAAYKEGCRPIKSSTLRIDKSFIPSFTKAYTPVCNSMSILTFENTTPANAVGFLWDFGNGKRETERKRVENIYSEPGDYIIKLTALNASGCTLSIEEAFNYNPWDGQIPNVITPNGDTKNDRLVIGVANASIRIYTRWGKLVYTKENYTDDWGDNIKSGTYFYELILPDSSTCKGFIDVIY